MRKQVSFPVISSFAFFVCINVCAQAQLSDSAFSSQALASVNSFYLKNVGPNSALYNGVPYYHYWNRVTGTPFFKTDRFEKGNIRYNGTLYQGIPLLYDMLQDVVVSHNYTGDVELALLSAKISMFSIGKDLFTRLEADDAHPGLQLSGFYQVLLEGSYPVLVKRENKIEQSPKADENTARFREYDTYFIEKDGKYILINGKNDLQYLFADQKAKIRKFLKRRDLRYKDHPANTIVQTVLYYTSLAK
jgi:hypothetical protein